MSKEKWLQDRRKGIGSSDAPAVLGVSKWKTPYRVWQEKLDLVPDQEDNEPMFWGRTLEPIIRQRYADETGRTVDIPPLMASESHPFMLASLDGLTRDDRIVEIKTARSDHDWGDPGTDQVPDVYQVQVQHQMIVARKTVADIPVLFHGNDFRIYTVEADPELQELIIKAEEAFWVLVTTQTPPEPVTVSDMMARFRKSTAKAVTASERVLLTVAQLQNAQDGIKLVEQNAEAYKAFIMKFMAENDTLVDLDERTLVTWKQSKGSSKFDEKRFKEEHPDLYAQYLIATEGSRRFLLKRQLTLTTT
jgi:putative phage-type endonuclease